jgi:hypothetical protein
MEKPFKLKFNLGSWSFHKVFEGIPLEVTDGRKDGQNFNKVIHTENIFAIGDTYSTDMEFSWSSASGCCNSARN